MKRTIHVRGRAAGPHPFPALPQPPAVDPDAAALRAYLRELPSGALAAVVAGRHLWRPTCSSFDARESAVRLQVRHGIAAFDRWVCIVAAGILARRQQEACNVAT